MDKIFSTLADTASLIITVEAIIIVGGTVVVTQFFKQFCKSRSASRLGLRPLEEWGVRGLAIVVGVILTHPLMDAGFKIKLAYGLFYGGVAPAVFFIVKKKVIKGRLQKK